MLSCLNTVAYTNYNRHFSMINQKEIWTVKNAFVYILVNDHSNVSTASHTVYLNNFYIQAWLSNIGYIVIFSRIKVINKYNCWSQ
jgi:hypothetical protein